MTTFGTPTYSFCLDENEEALPAGWDPLRVDAGFRREESAVSVFGTTSLIMQNDHDSTDAAGILRSTCYHIGGHVGRRFGRGEHSGMMILFGPEHAATLARGGYNKGDVQKYLFENAKTPREWLLGSGIWNISVEEEPDWVRKEVADRQPMIHQFNNPQQIGISVAGGAGKQSMLGVGYCNTPPVLVSGAALTRAGR